MRRLYWFWSALPLGSRMQFFVLALVLGYNFVQIDLNPGNTLFGSPLWMTTVPIIVAAIVMGRLLLPVMMAHPTRAQQLLHGFGLLIFGLWLFGRGQWWGQSILMYLGFIGGMWLEAACSFRFVSEVKRRHDLMLSHVEELAEQAASHRAETNDDTKDFTEDDDWKRKDAER